MPMFPARVVMQSSLAERRGAPHADAFQCVRGKRDLNFGSISSLNKEVLYETFRDDLL